MSLSDINDICISNNSGNNSEFFGGIKLSDFNVNEVVKTYEVEDDYDIHLVYKDIMKEICFKCDKNAIHVNDCYLIPSSNVKSIGTNIKHFYGIYYNDAISNDNNMFLVKINKNLYESCKDDKYANVYDWLNISYECLANEYYLVIVLDVISYISGGSYYDKFCEFVFEVLAILESIKSSDKLKTGMITSFKVLVSIINIFMPKKYRRKTKIALVC